MASFLSWYHRSRATIDKLLAEAPDLGWQTIIALSHGGLRYPSEHYAVRWGDIDFARGHKCPMGGTGFEPVTFSV